MPDSTHQLPLKCVLLVSVAWARYSDTDTFTSVWCAVKWPSNYHLLIEHIINQMHLEEPQNQCSGFSQKEKLILSWFGIPFSEYIAYWCKDTQNNNCQSNTAITPRMKPLRMRSFR